MNHDPSPFDAAAIDPAQTAQIEEHKYYLSEKAGYDVGWEYAAKDWHENFSERMLAADSAHTKRPAPRGLAGFFKRLLSKAAV